MNRTKFEILGRFRDEDGTEKFVFEVEKGIMELAWIKNKEGIAVFCLPTFYYCNLGCRFCHLTEEGDRQKKMVPIEAEDLYSALSWIIDRYIIQNKLLLSFMGVGEPLLNIRLIPEIFRKFNRGKFQNNISIALATIMPTLEKFDYLLKEVNNKGVPLKIHFSLHSPLDRGRQAIMPFTKVAIKDCLEALTIYRTSIQKQKAIIDNLSKFHQQVWPIEIHYTIIDQINDSDEELEELIEIGHRFKIPLKILKFNPTKSLKRSKRTKLLFEQLMEKYGAPVCEYAPPGPNIGSSCGQFTKHYYLGSNTEEELREFEAWKKKYQVAI